eukprot:g2465.t1
MVKRRRRSSAAEGVTAKRDAEDGSAPMHTQEAEAHESAAVAEDEAEDGGRDGSSSAGGGEEPRAGAASKENEEEEEENEADDGEGGPAEKRKRKRTRTRKKKAKGGAGAGAGAADDGGDDDKAGGDDGGGAAGGKRGALGGAMSDTVYVEGIPWRCDESDIREFFKGCGKIVDVRMPRWNDSGRPRGYAHVSFASSSGARAAFGRDGQYLNDRYLSVRASQEPATSKARRANRKAEQPPGCKTVFVKNLPYDVDEAGVSEALSGCGRIISVRLAVWNHTHKLKGFGYVEFSSERGAETCVRTQEGLSIGGRPLVVDFETGAPKGSFRRQDGAQIKKTSADAGVGKGKAPRFKVHA